MDAEENVKNKPTVEVTFGGHQFKASWLQKAEDLNILHSRIELDFFFFFFLQFFFFKKNAY